MDLEITESVADRSAVVVAFTIDNLDAGNAKDFRAAIESVVTARAVVVLDLSRLTFVDSSGLGALLWCQRAMKGKQGQLRLCGMTKSVSALFKLAHMERIFQIHESRDHALDALAAA